MLETAREAIAVTRRRLAEAKAEGLGVADAVGSATARVA